MCRRNDVYWLCATPLVGAAPDAVCNLPRYHSGSHAVLSLFYASLPAEYLAMCRFPYAQDESCKLPGGHTGEHGRVWCRDGMHFYQPASFICQCGNTGMASNAEPE